MTATSHALLGTIIAAKVGNPTLAIPLALASHVIADLIPHWDVGFGKKEKGLPRVLRESVGDVLLGFALSFALIFLLFPQTSLVYVFIIIIVAQLPDWLMAPYYFFNIKAFKWAYHFGKRTNTDLDKPWGIISQVVAVSLLLALALIF